MAHFKDGPTQRMPDVLEGRSTILERFEAAWQRGEEPEIDEYLRLAVGAAPRQLLIDLVNVDLERRLQVGGTARVEEYLQRYPDLALDRTAVVGLLEAEYRLRRMREPQLALDEYRRRFPKYATELPDMLRETAPARPSPGRFPIRLNCPHCQNPIEIVDESPEGDVTCPACGSRFRLEGDRTYTWSPEKLPQLGKFELLAVAGRGAFGTVYRARDKELQRMVAVKVPRSGRFSTKQDEDRFVREARAVAQLRHAGIVPCYEVGRSETFPYLVTDYVEGITLSDALSARRFSFREAADLVAQVAEALEHAHRHGVVHRDLKPSNIMLAAPEAPGSGDATGSEQQTVKHEAASVSVSRLHALVMDFGLARREEGEVTVTVDGQILGTPAYMSPEQARGEAHKVDGRSDVYSLGVILYELLTGELPFRGTMRMQLYQVLHDEPRPPRRLNDRIPRDLQTICLKALAKEPRRRYQSAQDLADDLHRFLHGSPVKARPLGLFGHAYLWCRRPERIRDAGVFAISFGVMLVLWHLVGLAMLVGLGQIEPGGFGRLALVFTGAICLFFLPAVWIGLATLARKLLALWAGIVVSLSGLGLTMANLLGSPFVLDIIPLDRKVTVHVFSQMAILSGIMFFAYIIALIAYYSNPNVMRWSQGVRTWLR